MLGKIVKGALALLPFIMEALKGFVAEVQLSDVYTFDDARYWFRERKDVKDSDDGIIAFTLFSERDGSKTIVIGLFNKKTNEVLDGEMIRTKRIDEKLTAIHSGNELVIYE